MEQHETKTAIVQAAAGLFLAKGYEDTSVQDLINQVGIAKGTFYHHFRSKEEVLTAMVDLLLSHVMEEVAGVVGSPGLGAVDKLNAMFAGIRRQKTRHVDLMAVLVSQGFKGKPAVPLDYLYLRLQAASSPYWTAVVHQGLREGVFRSGHPEELPLIVARVVFSFVFSLPELLKDPQTAGPKVQSLALGYQEALERILGVGPGTLNFTTALGAQDMEAVLKEIKSREDRNGKTESID